MNQTELLKRQAAQDQAQIHNLQLRLANAVARAERAEEELKALAEQEPVMCNAALGNGDGTYSSHFLKWPLKAYEKPIHPVSEFFYARPIPASPSTLHRDATRVLAAWDGTCLPKSHDGRLQEEMEHLRDALGDQLIGEMK